MCTDLQLAWFVGLFEGEGCFVFHKEKPKKLCIEMTDLDVLEKVQTIMGGTLVISRKRKEHYKQAWLWSVCGKHSVETAKLLLPFLSARRSIRCKQYIDTFVTLEDRRVAQKQAKEILHHKILDLRSKGYTHKFISIEVSKDRTYVTKILNSYGA